MWGGLFATSDEGSAAALVPGATANLVGFCLLEHHNRLLDKTGRQKAPDYASSARLGDGRLGEVRHTAGIPAGIAGSADSFTPFALDADIPE